ncbi:DUF3306 domain-containing protein [Photobacterium carnosum]|uniref:DUF3306 domain-containing protein n=1 Tax=Photobacterium carnosum TaxID=2023717 RepID=UPI001E61AC21|nr:DUF3306 domain-containing protein [Photobacterium carnosum]
MATNFFQRWSSRKLTPVDNTESTNTETMTETEAVDEPLTLNVLDTAVEDVTTNTRDSEQTSIVSSATLVSPATSPDAIAEESVIELTINDADNVTYDSGVASFMQQQVTKSVKKAALRKLFHSEEFNYISDMDDSTEDFSNMQGLAPEIASQMRGWINTVTETATEALKDDGITALTSTAEINTADSIHTDEEVIPTADLSLTPIIDRDIKSDEQKS